MRMTGLDLVRNGKHANATTFHTHHHWPLEWTDSHLEWTVGWLLDIHEHHVTRRLPHPPLARVRDSDGRCGCCCSSSPLHCPFD